jgi:ATP-dependent exoDNAse (exonuclease V) beta subunit
MVAGRIDASPGQLAGIYLLRLPNCGDKRDLAEFEAERLARTIRHALDAGLTVPRTARELQLGVTPPARPGDFLIITRTTRQLGIYARKLQEYRIPFQMTGGAAWEVVGAFSVDSGS